MFVQEYVSRKETTDVFWPCAVVMLLAKCKFARGVSEPLGFGLNNVFLATQQIAIQSTLGYGAGLET